MNLKSLSYKQGIALMSFLSMDEEDSQPETRIFIPNKGIEIRYPGKKGGLGDYKAYFRNVDKDYVSYSHADVCNSIYKYVKNSKDKSIYQETLTLLQDVYENGLSCSNKYSNNKKGLRIIELLYWVTLQEEINYPCASGRSLAFYRYAEALGSCDPKNKIDIELVKCRASDKHQVSLAPLIINNPPNYYISYMNRKH